MITIIDIEKQNNGVIEYMKQHIDVHRDLITNYSSFIQTWGSTALGFNGWGGSMMTDAVTTIVEVAHHGTNSIVWHVFFGGRFAYAIKEPNEQFFTDWNNCCMTDVYSATEIYTT